VVGPLLVHVGCTCLFVGQHRRMGVPRVGVVRQTGEVRGEHRDVRGVSVGVQAERYLPRSTAGHVAVAGEEGTRRPSDDVRAPAEVVGGRYDPQATTGSRTDGPARWR
jgi:hypothetical protein